MELKAACGSALELYGTACRHATLSRCCAISAAPVTTLIREYTVQVDTAADKAYSIGRFNTGWPPLSKGTTGGLFVTKACKDGN